MQDEFDYDPPEGALDCCYGMSRHGRLLQESRTPRRQSPAPPAQPAGIQQRRLAELMQQLKRQPPQPESFGG